MGNNRGLLLTKMLMCAIIMYTPNREAEDKIMRMKITSKLRRMGVCFAVFLTLITSFIGAGISQETNVHAVPIETPSPAAIEENMQNNEVQEAVENSDSTAVETQQEAENTNSENNTSTILSSTNVAADGCKTTMGAIGWIVCPVMEKVSEAVDWLYNKIEDILLIDPIPAEDGTPIYEIWKYCLSVTNVVFIIFLLVVIYSQLTGWGITNYGIKKTLPKLIVMAILVNLSFLICSLAVDVSNIIGHGLRSIFEAVENTAMANMGNNVDATSMTVSVAEMYTSMAGGTALAVGAGVIAFELGAFWMLIPTVLGAIVAVATGLITIALRQAVIMLLVMIAPLALVASILPNTEGLYKKWKQLLIRMLVFYPMFSLLFGAASLAGFAIITSAKDGFGLLLGVAVQIFPLFFSWKLMQMSGTVLGDINARMRALTAKPLATNRAWADSHRRNRMANTLANGRTPSARLMQYINKRRSLREEDTKNLQKITEGKATEYTQRKIAGSRIGDTTSRTRRTSRYTQHAKAAHNYSLISQNVTAHTEHVMGNYGNYFNNGPRDRHLNQQSQRAWIDYGRANFQKEIDDENDMMFLVDKYLAATKRDANGNPADEAAFNRYMTSVVGPDGEQRLAAKIIAQAAKVESRQRADYHILYAKYGLNGYNKRAFRNFMVGYATNDDGWAVDTNGERLRNADNTLVETIPGDAITKAPEKLVLYDKRDEQGLYFDFKDQDGNVVARVHRGRGNDGQNHDDAAFIKESLANYDIPIADPINNIYGILSGVKIGDVHTPQGNNEIGLSRYSTTIGGAMKDYKANAAWAGAMFNSGLSNRQIKNSAQYAIWVLDSIVKTLKPGAFNTQNPASVEFLTAVLDPDNWEKIFTNEDIADACNINNKPFGGEDWQLDEEGNIIDHTVVNNPTYEQRMNTLKRKLLFPAMKKVLPAFDRLRTSNTADNQKPGTADAQYEFLKMVKEKWEENPEINFDPTLVDQDLQSEARAFRRRKHDRNGNLIYATEGRSRRDTEPHGALDNLLVQLEDVYDNSAIAEDLKHEVFAILNSREEYARALQRFDELCLENPDATMSEIYNWFTELDTLVNYDRD